MSDERCMCGEADCDYLAFGYPYCRSCDEHHRPPECPVDEQGYALNQYGERWVDWEASLRAENAARRAVP